MANLTDQLNPAQSADTVTPAPQLNGGGLSVALNGLAQMMGGVQSTIAQGAATRRQAAAEARSNTEFGWKVEDRAATNESIDTISRINDVVTNGITTTQSVIAPAETFFSQGDLSGGQPAELSPQAVNDINGASQTLSSAQVAVTQRRLSPLAVNAMYDSAYRQIRTDHPNADASLILKAFKDAGVDSGLFRDLQQGLAEQNSTVAMQRAEQAKAYALGREVVPPSIAGYANMTDEDFERAGREHSANQAMVAAQAAKQSLQSAQTRDAQGNLTFQQEQDSRTIGQTISLRVQNSMAPLMNLAMKALSTGTTPEVGSNSDFETRAAAVIPSLRARVGVYANNAYNEAIAAGQTPAQAAVVRDGITQQWESTIFKPWQERGAAFSAAATAVRDRLGVDTAILFPVLQQMRSLGIDVSTITNLTQALPPNTIDMIRRDFSHISQGNLGTPLGKLYLNDALQTLTGHSGGLAEISPTDTSRRQALTGFAYNNTVSQAAAVAAGKGDAQSWLHTLNQVILAAPSVNANSGAQTLATAISGIARTDVANALSAAMRNPETHQQAMLTASSSRAAMGSLVIEAKKAVGAESRSDPYHQITYNERSGTFSWQTRPGASMPVQYRPHGEGEYTPPMPGITAKQQQLVRSLNEGLTFISNTAKWDPSTPQGTPLELRNFYAQDIPTSAMKSAKGGPAAKVRADPIAPIDALQNELLRTPDLIDTPSIEHTVNGIIGAESGGNPNAHNPAGSASGLGQFTDETWRGVLSQHRPELIRGKTPAEIAALKSDPQLARAMTLAHAKDNAQALADAGLPHGAGETYLAHFLGLGGAKTALKASGDTPIDQIVRATDRHPEQALAGNRGYLFDKKLGRYRTVDELRAFLEGRVNSHA